MVIDMDESQLRTIEQIEQFLNASAEVAFSAHGDDLVVRSINTVTK
jgi:hypothetical protein